MLNKDDHCVASYHLLEGTHSDPNSEQVYKELCTIKGTGNRKQKKRLCTIKETGNRE